MAESFLFNIAESVLGKLGSLALQEFFLAWGLESELGKIMKILGAIQAVLFDAEQKGSHNQGIEAWLGMLKDVLYDAEDVVDEFECEALRRKVVKSGYTTQKVRRFFSSSNPLAFRFRMGHKLKQIRERVAEIAALKSDFGLTEQIFDRHVIHRKREMTHSFIDASNVIGREQVRDNVIETLLPSVDGENVSIIPIVGIGDKVIIKILDSASPGQRCTDTGIDQLQRTLREALNGRKYLLILDDVWSEDPRKWGQQGKQNSNLKRIGEEIVRKCKGVPLAVITLGSLLYSVTDERHWEFVRDNEIWKSEEKENDILLALRLSYEHLPSYLKRCFAYCSIFPKDYVMDDIELVYLWMANGLVQSSNENQELEDIGLRYFKELCSRVSSKNFLNMLEHLVHNQSRPLGCRGATGKNHELTIWLSKLKDACYDAEDIVDEFECEALLRQSTDSKVRRFFSRSNNPLVFRFKIGNRMKEIRERLDEISAQKGKFHLTERLVDERVVYRRREMTHSFVQASDVIGRESDRDKIIEYLLHHGELENLSVVPIVGIGGLGKTTLAKMVYNDERVDRNFQLKMWVCVSEDFDVTRLAKEITSSATGRSYGDLTMDQLQARLRRSLAGRKFLLVLDDVWNENLVRWVELRGLLEGCAMGSKIIVSTRSSKVASIMGIELAYNLPGLPHKDCLSLFLKWAFNAGQEKQYPNLVDIGNEIVRKCGGVPLAVRTLGSLLYASTDERHWLSIRDNEIWKLKQEENDILPVLKLSYDQIPSYLKRCFAYCSLFPKNYVLYSFELVQFWMAHGLLDLPGEDQESEDHGMQYVKELWSRSFFQDVEDHGFFFTCKMHDLVHDLAISVAQSECSTVTFLTPTVNEKIRHFSFLGTNLPGQEVPKFLHKLDRVRTIFFPVRGMGPSSETFIDACLSRFKHLRVLNLSDSCFEALPNSIGTLKHLRYLDLYRNRKITKLPNSICKLQNLQTLRLEECEKLEEIPRDIKNMSNLSLKHLSALETLVIGDCAKLNLMEMEYNEDFDLSLTSLVIGELPQLVTLPHWLQGCASTLQYIYIDDCPNFTALPDWTRNLTSLKRLEIIRCPELFSLPEEMHCLTALRELKIGLCPELRESPDVFGLTGLLGFVDNLALIGRAIGVKMGYCGYGDSTGIDSQQNFPPPPEFRVLHMMPPSCLACICIIHHIVAFVTARSPELIVDIAVM
ncbi:hypothetical protein GH714_032768 [Hevea brasiliensis]|uniref:Disease resistance protein RGA3 n=1 Tax=Hevea brasiliensis TaxID=3981 RepID=A0A6A6M4X0_HEVBR|nr:hypothetical protein GH714_032768 [Hevea brasiliensis]